MTVTAPSKHEIELAINRIKGVADIIICLPNEGAALTTDAQIILHEALRCSIHELLPLIGEAPESWG